MSTYLLPAVDEVDKIADSGLNTEESNIVTVFLHFCKARSGL